MSGTRNASERHEEELPQLRAQLASLRGELAALRAAAPPASQQASPPGPAPDIRMSQLREANEKLVVATIHAQALAETVQQSNRDREQFLAMLAHELRNPLAPMVNALAILRRIAPADSQLDWIHDVLKRQVDQMTHLLNELLEVSRVTSGKVVLRMRPIQVAEFMLNAVEASRPMIEARRQRLAFAPPAQSLVVDGDPTRLAQIFGNLLNNASKYTPEEGDIGFSAQLEGDMVAIRVADNGTGIAPEVLPRIFELFAQESRSLDRSQGGLGIGLSVVRSLVQLHGGTIDAASAGLGLGSEFVVRFPLMRDIPAPPVRDDAMQIAPAGASYRIVLIEDNRDANDSMTNVLHMFGHEVFSAFDGVAGVALVQECKPQVVICDIGLPGLDGYQVMERLRQVAQPMPAMIALTGYGQAADRDRALAAGFDHHFSKPVAIDALLRLVAAEGAKRSSPPGIPPSSPRPGSS